ncbi:DnaJ C-terminal domain-containing protein [Streptomyces sp. NPDC014744]|uniref:DnaJ C-terminal domain-containing protein n=1 Tax=Streptomyces sp. NPDC014744 TaxID=3364903 RepID=UPI0036F70031
MQGKNVLSGREALPPRPGSFLMMASGEFSTAWYQSDAEAEKPQTYFTKYLVDVIERGIPGQGEALRLGAIFDTVAAELIRDRKPEPGCRSSDQANNYFFARNVAAGKRGRDLRAETTVPFREALRGATATLSLPLRCETCEGTGMLGEEECGTCHGTGQGHGQHTLSTRLRRGVADGEIVRVPEEGWTGPGGGPPGDLYVTVHVDNDPTLTRSGDDLLLALPVGHAERASGSTVNLRLLDDWVPVRIPTGSEYGTKVRIPGRGAPTADDDGRGDLLVTLAVTDPVTAAEDAALMPPDPRPAPLLPPPTNGTTVTTYRWSVPRLVGKGLGTLLVFVLLLGPTLLLILLKAAAPALDCLPGSLVGGITVGVVAWLHPFIRRLLAGLRPPLVLSDEGVTYVRFGFFSWADITGVRPSAPGHPWVTVVLRRTTHLTTGQPNPLVLPAIMLSDLRGRPEDVPDAMRAHCPGLVVASRV